MDKLLTENLDIWVSSVGLSTGDGRGRSSSAGSSIYGVKKLRELVFQLAVTGKLLEQNDSDEPATVLIERIRTNKGLKEGSVENYQLFEIPKGWEWTSFDEIGTSNIGLTYSPANVGSKGFPVLRSSNIQNRKIDLSDLVRVDMKVNPNQLVKEGDLLICARNGSKSLVGKAAIIPKLAEPSAFGAFMAIFRSPINQYLEVFLNSPLYRSRLEGTSTTTINQITQSNLKSTQVPIPPLAEQLRIVERVNLLMTYCDELEAEIGNRMEVMKRLADCIVLSHVK